MTRTNGQIIRERTVALEISTFAGISIGAEHWYGSLKSYSNGEYQVVDLRRPYDERDLKISKEFLPGDRKSSQESIKRMIEIGQTTISFHTTEEIEAMALAVYKQHFPKAVMLLRAPFTWAAVEPFIPLDASEHVKEISERVLEAHEQLVKLNMWDSAQRVYDAWETLIANIIIHIENEHADSDLSPAQPD